MIGADSRLYVSGNGESLVGGCFRENRKLFLKIWKAWQENINSGFLHTAKLWFRSELSISPHHFCVMSSHSFALSFYHPLRFSFSTATKITRTLPFNQLLAASSPQRNFDFPQNRILRLHYTFGSRRFKTWPCVLCH